MSSRKGLPFFLFLLAVTPFIAQNAFGQFVQQGNKLVGNDYVGSPEHGYSVALSSDGNTAIVGGFNDNGNSATGAAWIYTRVNGAWTQQGAKLVGLGAVGASKQGASVAISADGNTALVGGWGDNGSVGAAWVFTRSSGVWTQQGDKLVGQGAIGASKQGFSVALSADGNTAIVGGVLDNTFAGAVWVFTRTSGVWSQQGAKLTDASDTSAWQGSAVALSADGNTALVGGYADNGLVGAAWVYTRSSGVWSQQGSKLTGSNFINQSQQGISVALSGDGNTALVGGLGDNYFQGAAWVFTRSSGAWTQQGAKLLDATASLLAQQGSSVALSGDGNTALVGGKGDNGVGATWVYTRTAGVWSQQGNKLVGTGNANGPAQGAAVALSADGSTALVGGPLDAATAGAVWVFAQPVATRLAVSAPSSAPAGTAFNVTVTAQDANNNIVNAYAGIVHFTSSDGSAVLPADSALTNGTKTFSVTLKTPGDQFVVAVDTANGSITGSTSAITVSGGAATHFALSAPSTAAAGTAFNFTVTAQDALNNATSNYSGLVHFTSTDGAAVLPVNTLLTSGSGTFSATLKTVGNRSITAADSVTSSIAGNTGSIIVGAGSATHFSVTAPSSATGGTSFNITVTALDAFNNTVTGYSGTVHFSSNDAAATLPGDMTLTNGTGMFPATLGTSGSQTISATDTVTASITGVSAAIAVTGGGMHFSVTAPASVTAGTAFNFTVTAKDSNNVTLTGYSGLVHFTSSDTAAVLPANATLTNGTFTFSATLKSGGNQTITATDTVAPINGVSGSIAVGGAAATHFAVSAPASAAAGISFNFTVTAQDAFNNTATGYSGTAHFSSGDGSAILPADATLTNGTRIFTAILKTPGSQSITVADTATAAINGTSGGITVAVTHLAVSAPAAAVSGTPFNFTVTALDVNNAVVTGYSGIVHYTSSDGSAVLPGNAALTNGTATLSATLKTSGSQTITATDSVTAAITGNSAAITVTGGVATHFSVTAPAKATVGSAFSVTVTALDANNNTAIGYTGTAHFTSSDGIAILPSSTTLTSGTGAFSVTLKTVGSQFIAVTDTVTLTITGNSSSIAVTNPSTTHFAVTAPLSATAGTAVNFTVTAQDDANNTITAYAGAVRFTSTDTAAVLPASTTLTNGTGTFSATLKTAGSQAITATDTVTASIAGSSSPVAVAPAAAARFVVSAPASAILSTAFNFTVTAQDAFNNTATGYTGTVRFSSTDTAAVLPGSTTLTNGTGSFSAQLKTPGSQSISAVDSVSASITGTSGTIAAGGGAVTHFSVTAPAGVTPATPFNVTVTALDANNTSTGYSGTVRFFTTDGNVSVVLPPAFSTLTNGTRTFSATLYTGGTQSIGVVDTTTPSIAGNSGPILVGGGVASHFSVTAGASATAGTAFNVTVKALDVNNTPIPGYTGTVHLTSSDLSALLPANATLNSGLGTFAVTLKTAGNQSVTATDTVTSSINGASGTIAVAAGAATHFSVTAPATATTNAAVSVTVTALDAFNNTASGYSGTVRFTSTDNSAVLPANATLTSGTGTFSATLKTLGGQSITATDSVTASITGAASITVSNTGATHFSVTAPLSASPGTAFSITVTALDAANNTVTGYSGTVHFSSNDTAAVLPANTTLTSGTGTFSATLKTAGAQLTITAADTVTASIAGSATIAVAANTPTHFAVAAPSTTAAGAAFNVTVTAQDAYNNLAPGYIGTVHFSSTDLSAVLPANAGLTNGAGTFTVMLKVAGNQSVSATDSVTASITGTSPSILVVGGAATHFAVSAPASATAGTAFNFTVTAQDGYNNTSTGYSGSVHFTSSDLSAMLPANWMLTNGTGSFSATLKTTGAQSITATDAATASITGTSGAITVAGATTAVAALPGFGNGLNATMTFTFNDPRGWQDLDVVNILINNFLDGRNSCYLAYSRPAGVLYLVNDPGTAILPGLALNGSGSIANSQCSVAGSGSLVTGSGNVLTLTLNLTFTAAYAGNKVTYLAARDLEGGNSGWQALGTWGVPGSSFSGPVVGGVNPARSTGAGAQTYTFTFGDTSGAQDLGVVNVLLNDALNGNHACYLAYSRAGNVLYLVNDAGDGLLPGLAINGSGTLGNSQCTVTGAGSSASTNGNTLTLTLNMTFPASFAGNRLIYMAARSNGDVLNSGWQSVGSRTVQ